MNPLLVINKYYRPNTLVYDILLSHSQAVTQKALMLASNHPELYLDIEFISEAAMLHDIGVFLTNAPMLGCYGSHHYIEHGYLGADLLRQEGFPKHALVCERHTGTGLALNQIEKQELPLPHRDMCPISIEEQLICFADKFFSKTKLNDEMSVAQIRKKMAQYGNESVVQFDKWVELFQ